MDQVYYERLARQRLGWAALIGGWTCYLFALPCPAIKITSVAVDMGWQTTKSGLNCLHDTFIPSNWLFAPFLALYMVGNFVMLISPFVVPFRPSARAIWGGFLLVSFGFSLSAPVCSDEVKETLEGAYLWMGSFLVAGIGCLLLPRSAGGERDMVSNRSAQGDSAD
jgi:hypothetical protein